MFEITCMFYGRRTAASSRLAVCELEIRCELVPAILPPTVLKVSLIIPAYFI